jgi:hypothetical protein
MGEKVARSIVGRLSPKPQVLSNLGVARLCPRGMLLGGEWTTQADVEIGFLKRMSALAAGKAQEPCCTTAISDGYSRGCVVDVALA